MMRLLIASADRDFLSSFSRLFADRGWETETAFDGTRVVTLIQNDSFDLAVVDMNIPRVNASQLLKIMIDRDIPAIAITHRRISSGMLAAADPANAYISLPFFPDELIDLADEVMKKHLSGKSYTMEDIEWDEKTFSLCKKERLTNGELDVLRTLYEGREIGAGKPGAFISSLNIKLERANKSLRIRYRSGEGYRLVNINE